MSSLTEASVESMVATTLIAEAWLLPNFAQTRPNSSHSSSARLSRVPSYPLVLNGPMPFMRLEIDSRSL